MGTLLICAFAALLVFVVCRFVKVNLSLLGWLGAGVLAVFVAWIIEQAVGRDPVLIVTNWVSIPLIWLAIGAVLVGLLLKVARPLR